VTSPRPSDDRSLLGQRLLAALLSVLFVGLLVAIAFYLYQRSTGDGVQARVIGFSVSSDSTVSIDLEVLKPAGSQAYCVVRSRGADGAEVGREVVVVDAAGTPERVVRLEHVLRTRARAVTGEAGRCSASPIPPPPSSP
jgi:hypothetical protein